MGKRLFVGNLPFSTTADELRALFSPYGEVADVHIVVDRETSRPRGFGFVSFVTEEQAAKATEGLNGRPLGGRPLVVKDARDRVAGAAASGAPPRRFGAPGGAGGPGGPPRPGANGAPARPWRPRGPRMLPPPDPSELPQEAERRRFAVKKRRPEGEADRSPKARLREEDEARPTNWRQWMDEYEEAEEQGAAAEEEEAPPREEPPEDEEAPPREEPPEGEAT